MYKYINIIANQAMEREIVQHFCCINGRILQALCTKHVQNLILVVDKPREKAIVRQGCHNTIGVLDYGVSRSTYSWATSTTQLWPLGVGRRLTPNGEDPREEEPHKENDDEMLETR
jgi:hypothetical protein